MATADEYAAWIVKNADKRGSPEFETVAKAYQLAKGEDATPIEAATSKPATAGPGQAQGRAVLNTVAGALRGAGSIGATLLAPHDMLNDYLLNRAAKQSGSTAAPFETDRRAAMTGALQEMGADPSSWFFQGSKLGTEIAGTLGVGGVLGGLAKGAGATPAVVNALQSAGMTTGGRAPGAVNLLKDLALRSAAGGAVGGASTAMIDPEHAGTGAAIGAALPPAMAAVGKAGELVGSGVKAAGRAVFGEVSPEVAALAKRAKELGIDIPADRLVSNKPLDAVASGLNYVPFSGRAATEAKMAEQLNRAGSRLMGQDTPNMNQALRKASEALGAKFDATLKGTGVQLDRQLLEEATAVVNRARDELGDDAFRAINSKFNQLVEKGADGVIDGPAAYVIKRDLDRIGRGNSPNAYHALELKGVLMDALNRSLGPQEAKAFALTRQQYSNMLALEKLAKNGVEGEISVARLANLKNINNKPLQELADIAAQFVKAREGQHGAMQRAVVGLGAGFAGGAPGVAAVSGTGRALNSMLNSNTLRNSVLGESGNNALMRLIEQNPEALNLLYRATPAGLAADR